jgi:hypothetical protein
VDSWRHTGERTKVPVEERDIALENAMLFLRDALVMRDYEHAVKQGDTGRILKAVEYWCVIFQGTSLSNYPNEMIHLMACLRKLWQPEFVQIWLDHCLVNPSGKPGGWMPDDMFGEYVVRENKNRIRPSTNALSGDFNREINARQIMIMLASRKTMYKTTGATDYYDKSSQQDSDKHVRLFCKTLVDEQVFTYTAGRYKRREHDAAEYLPTKDLYTDGVAALLSGQPLAKYKVRARGNWRSSFEFVGGDSEGDGLDGYEFNDADNDILETLF